MKIQQLPKDVMVTKVDNILFRGKSYQEWLIAVDYKQKDKLRDGENPEHQNLKFSNMPMIASGRIYNSTEPVVENKYKQAKFILKDLSHPTDFDNNYFEYVSDIIYRDKTIRQVKVKIPKLELARVLFFHNSYLAVSSLQERILDLELKVNKDEGKNIITVLPNCPLSKTQFEDLGFRSKLAWLLLNFEIKKSYYSINENLVKNKTESEQYERWLFDFTPPQLFNLNITVKGYLNKNNIFYVDEILIIKGIDSGITGEVIFKGDKFIQELVTQSEANAQSKPKDTIEAIINDAEEANSDLQTLIIEAPKTEFEFLSPIISSINPSKVVKKATSHSENDETVSDITDANTINVATDEATITGTVPKGEFQNTDDTTNRDVQYRQNFEGLIKSLEKLNITLEIKFHELPRVPRCRLDKKSDGNKRTLLEARFNYKNQNFIVFEIDTTDLPTKRLSTLIVKDDNESPDLDKLLRSIVRTSLTWSKLNFSGKVNLTHPKDFYTGTSDSEAMIKTWSQRIENILNQLLNNE